MSLYALIDNGQIADVGPLPEVYHDGRRWWDLRKPEDVDLEALGWLPVVDTERPPADTATHTHTRSVELVDGVPTVVWTFRPWTSEELAARVELEARVDDLGDRVANIEAKLWPAQDDPTTAPTWEDLERPGWWMPDTLVVDAGTTWRNVSGTVLTHRPSAFPGAPGEWSHLFVAEGGDQEPAPDAPVPFVLPTGAHNTYNAGDKVIFNGGVYESKVDNNAHSPADWPPGWTYLYPAP